MYLVNQICEIVCCFGNRLLFSILKIFSKTIGRKSYSDTIGRKHIQIQLANTIQLEIISKWTMYYVSKWQIKTKGVSGKSIIHCYRVSSPIPRLDYSKQKTSASDLEVACYELSRTSRKCRFYIINILPVDGSPMKALHLRVMYKTIRLCMQKYCSVYILMRCTVSVPHVGT